MAKINTIIPVSSLDLTRVKILDIISLELANQYVLTDNDHFNLKYRLERFSPLNESEYPSLNVRFVNSELKDQDQTGSVYKNTYWVEFYCSNRGDNIDAGDKIGALWLTEVLTACRAVLKNPQYNSLDLPKGIVAKIEPTDILVSELKYNQVSADTLAIMYGRLVVTLDVIENVSLLTPELLEQHNTLVKLFSSEKGFRYQI